MPSEEKKQLALKTDISAPGGGALGEILIERS